MPYDIAAYHHNRLLYAWMPPVITGITWQRLSTDIQYHLHNVNGPVFVVLDLAALVVYAPTMAYRTAWLSHPSLEMTITITPEHYPKSLHNVLLQSDKGHLHFSNRWDALHYIKQRLPTLQPSDFTHPTISLKRMNGRAMWQVSEASY